jgi:hypothetical protein
MLSEQNKCCKICSKEFKRGVNAHVDHDHDTGEVRGLLCLNCNTGIGKLGDSPQRCVNAAIYLLTTGETTTENFELARKMKELELPEKPKSENKQSKIKNLSLTFYACYHHFQARASHKRRRLRQVHHSPIRHKVAQTLVLAK